MCNNNVIIGSKPFPLLRDLHLDVDLNGHDVAPSRHPEMLHNHRPSPEKSKDESKHKSEDEGEVS